jgi:hypothetical protein
MADCTDEYLSNEILLAPLWVLKRPAGSVVAPVKIDLMTQLKSGRVKAPTHNTLAQ